MGEGYVGKLFCIAQLSLRAETPLRGAPKISPRPFKTFYMGSVMRQGANRVGGVVRLKTVNENLKGVW